MTAAVALALVLLVPQPTPAAACTSSQECRTRALQAAERGEYETFHDLAWRAVQLGPPNDPSLMQMLARAQSLSGRPGDALVMLQRLAAMGIATDAATSEDFAAVRRLRRWREAEPQLAALARPAADPEAAAPPEPPARPPDPTPATSAAPKAAAPLPPPPPSAATEALRFSTPPFTPGGLAYDAVSRRFIVGHREARKLSVVDEFSHQMANLAGARTAGFADVAALEIDAREGTLWVVSAGAPAAGERAPATALHKLQLISGRALASFSPPAGSGARFVDVAVAAGGTVLVLDAAGKRIYRLRSGAASLDVAASLGEIQPTSLAPAGGTLVYVAHAAGIARVDLATRTVAPLGQGAELAGIDWLRSHRGALVALQRQDEGHRVIRVRPNGRAAVDVLDGGVTTPGRAAATIARDLLYMLTTAPGAELIIERLPLERQ